MNKLVYGNRVFTDHEIESGNVHLVTNLISSQLEANTFTATVKSANRDLTEFERNAPLTYFHDEEQVGIFYVQDVSRTGPVLYKISATSAIGLLIEGIHYGGIYTGQTVKEVLPSICGTIPYEIKTSFESVQLYGWLPVASPRDNLSQVLFAIGATVKSDLNGVLRIEDLWNEPSRTAGEERIYSGASVDYSSKVTKVIVTEHQYAPGEEEVVLFEGSSSYRDIIKFQEPMHSLSITGATILESGDNYAILSSGTCVLKGKKYIHNTRQVEKEVSDANEPNVKTSKEATLVSLYNSDLVAKRMVNYFKCYQTINAPMIYSGEKTGEVQRVYHPYNKEITGACLQSMDISLSRTLKATEKLLVGFVPQRQIDPGDYTNRVVLTGSGTWTVPDGVTRILAVLIQGGQSGLKGENGGTSPTETPRYYSENNWSWTKSAFNQSYAGEPGEGGAGGEGGNGGNIFSISFIVNPGQQLEYQSGIGGTGNGIYGTHSIIAGYSSEQGTSSINGYTDFMTGEKIAYHGENGINGGKGCGTTDYTKTPVNAIERGDTVIGRDGTEYFSAEFPKNEDGKWKYLKFNERTCPSDSTVKGAIAIAYPPGGGAAVGSNGPAVTSASGYNVTSGSWSGTTYSANCRAAKGGDGANASKPQPQTVFGVGGYGGNGGGGVGGVGIAEVLVSGTDKSTITPFVNLTASVLHSSGAIPGLGSDGGDGGPGCIILYFGNEKKNGPFVTSKYQFLYELKNRTFVV